MYSEAMLEAVSARFKALGEPMRLRVLNALRPGEKTVGELVVATGATQANISRHLAVLFRDHLVVRRKQGLHVFYRVADAAVFRLCDVVCGTLEQRATRHARSLRAGRGRRPS